MKPGPDERVWRKTARAACKGLAAGRRVTHQVKTQKPKRARTPRLEVRTDG